MAARLLPVTSWKPFNKIIMTLLTRTYSNPGIPFLAFQIGTKKVEPFSFVQTWKGQPVPIKGEGEVFTIVAFGRTQADANRMAKARGHIGDVTW